MRRSFETSLRLRLRFAQSFLRMIGFFTVTAAACPDLVQVSPLASIIAPCTAVRPSRSPPPTNGWRRVSGRCLGPGRCGRGEHAALPLALANLLQSAHEFGADQARRSGRGGGFSRFRSGGGDAATQSWTARGDAHGDASLGVGPSSFEGRCGEGSRRNCERNKRRCQTIHADGTHGAETVSMRSRDGASAAQRG